MADENKSTETTETKDPIELAEEQISAETTEETTSEETKEEDATESSEEMSADQLAAAKNIFKAISNPETSRAAIETLARAAGINIAEVETKKEEKKATKAIKELVVEKLGKDYAFLSTALGEALQEAFDTAIEEKTKDLRDQQQDFLSNQVRTQIRSAQETVLGEFQTVPVEVLREVLRLQQSGELVQGKMDHEKFFRLSLREASENLNVKLTKKSSTPNKPVKQESPLDRMVNKSKGTSNEGVKNTQYKTVDDAIAAAEKTIEAAMKG